VLLCLAQFMVILDVTVVNVALPEIGLDLGLDRAALTWVVTAYTLCFGKAVTWQAPGRPCGDRQAGSSSLAMTIRPQAEPGRSDGRQVDVVPAGDAAHTYDRGRR
jgi:hypothetical protein